MGAKARHQGTLEHMITLLASIGGVLAGLAALLLAWGASERDTRKVWGGGVMCVGLVTTGLVTGVSVLAFCGVLGLLGFLVVCLLLVISPTPKAKGKAPA